MHSKSYSDVTSVDQSSPPRSPRRPLYYVQSPSNHDVEKMSYGSSPMGSPPHHFYHASPIHHSRESSTSRFSASLKNPRNLSAWKKIQQQQQDSEDEDEEDDRDTKWTRNVRLFFLFLVLFVLVFTSFSLILWGASRPYQPQIIVKSVVFESFYVQAGNDGGGVPTNMMTLNSTVRILYRNPGTFFGVHVSSTPLQLQYLQLLVASGQIEDFYQSRKSRRRLITLVTGHQVPLYGGITALGNSKRIENVPVPLNLTLAMRSRAYILGQLVKSTFHRRITCPLTLNATNIGKHIVLKQSCIYH